MKNDQNKLLEANIDVAMHHIHQAKMILQSHAFKDKQRFNWVIALTSDVIRDAEWVRNEMVDILCTTQEGEMNETRIN